MKRDLAVVLFISSLWSTLVCALASGSGTCSSTSKCVSGCCSTSGYCGFGPEFCGDDVCVSTCDAVAECGPYAAVANTACPLNVCCSRYGFCGTSEDFCGTGCQSNCEPITEPSCSGTSSNAVYIGYYEAWQYQRPCDVVLPSDIDVNPWTHLYYAFAGIDSKTSKIKTMYPNDKQYMADFVALKKKKSTLKTYISVGGWDLGGQIFSDMVRFPGTRSAFNSSAISFMEKYGFDGIDIDWEYPAASDRVRTANYVSFLKELRKACGKTYRVTATLPSSYWYLRGFDVVSMAEYVDYFNFMSYDIHGTWDGNSNYTSSVINPHTNLTEITDGLNLLWRNNIDPGKVLLGLSFYGRSFTLKDSNCNIPGCPFDTSAYSAGGATPGECTQTSGILSDYEINRIAKQYQPTVQYDETAGVNWITWNGYQWVSFDNAKTLKQKADFANGKCLGGLFSWALDLGGPGSLENPNGLDRTDTSMDGASMDGGSDGTGDFYVGQEIFNPNSNTVTGIGPINVIFPPSALASPTILYPGAFITPLEIAWPTTTTVTVNSTVMVTTTVIRVIETTTISLDPITTGVIQWWNWNITSQNQTVGSTVLFPSFGIGPVVISDNYNPLSSTSVSHTVTSNRTILVPPWPWSTTSLPTTVPTGPTVHFTEGSPASPTCKAGCGTKCTIFCNTPCMDDCDVGNGKSSGFNDPSDPDPPHKQKCGGRDCKNGKCTGPLCVVFGCTGRDCDHNNGVCLGSDCKETGCMGNGCSKGTCQSDSCQTVGCTGSDCSKTGGCFGFDCLSIGCTGSSCNKADGTCSGSHCHKVSCSGPHCEDGVCTGKGCTNEDTDCEKDEADICTEFVSSTLDTVLSTYTTETSTSCDAITACYAEATTTTTTISEDSIPTTEPFKAYKGYTDKAVIASAASKIDADFRSAEASWTTTTTTSTSETTTSKTTTSKTTTSTGPAATSLDNTSPDEVSYTCSGMSGECKIFLHLHKFCNVAKSYIRGSVVYGTTSANSNTGECYTDGMNAGFGCGIFVKGHGCQLLGTTMQAAYDHLTNHDLGGCKTCGQVTFSNGCKMRVDYVSGCTTENNGPVQFLTLDDSTMSTAQPCYSRFILPVLVGSNSLVIH